MIEYFQIKTQKSIFNHDEHQELSKIDQIKKDIRELEKNVLKEEVINLKNRK
jgi:hypothetical protein